jgi:hypothetical protein
MGLKQCDPYSKEKKTKSETPPRSSTSGTQRSAAHSSTASTEPLFRLSAGQHVTDPSFPLYAGDSVDCTINPTSDGVNFRVTPVGPNAIPWDSVCDTLNPDGRQATILILPKGRNQAHGIDATFGEVYRIQSEAAGTRLEPSESLHCVFPHDISQAQTETSVWISPTLKRSENAWM